MQRGSINPYMLLIYQVYSSSQTCYAKVVVMHRSKGRGGGGKWVLVGILFCINVNEELLRHGILFSPSPWEEDHLFSLPFYIFLFSAIVMP